MSSEQAFRAALVRATAITLVANLPSSLTGALSVQIARQFRVEAAAVAASVGAFFTAACVSSIVLGRLVEHVGPRTGMQAVAALSAASLVAAGFAGSLPLLAAALVIGGVATAIVTPAAHIVVSAEIPFENHGLAFGVLRAAQPAAALLAGLAVPTIALTLSWNAAFFTAGGLALLTGLAIRRWQAEVVRFPPAPAAPAPVAPSAADAPARNGRRHADLGSKRDLLLLAGAMALGSGVVNVVGPFFVPSAVAGGSGDAFAGLLLALGSALGMIGRLVAGWLADRGRWDALKGVAALLAGGALGCLLLAGSGSLSLCVGAFFAFGLGYSWPGLFQSAVVSRYRHAPAAATGYTQTGAFFGSIVAPLGFGFAATSASYQAAWLLAAVVAVAAAALMLSVSARFARTTDTTIAPIPVLDEKGPTDGR